MKTQKTNNGKAVTGFTVVELLIVLAVVALLAAFLFPTLAKKRTLDHSWQTLPNIRMLGTAEIIYCEDNDGEFVLNAAGTIPGDKNALISWVALLQPYLKDPNILLDPRLDEGKPNQMVPGVKPQFGYNYLFLSPMDGAWNSVGRSEHAAIHPENTVMFASSQDFSGKGPKGNHYVNAPGAWPIAAASTKSWIYYGATGQWTGNWSANNGDAGKVTGGVRFLNYQEGAPVVFADGHAKIMTDVALAAGTDYVTASKTNPSLGAVITDVGPYLWTLDGTLADLTDPERPLTRVGDKPFPASSGSGGK
jgi:prepilin-type N-terminal cleavage/methylation domain-containing protein/prepilin-type processing-associated H-X9-DG protein